MSELNVAKCTTFLLNSMHKGLGLGPIQPPVTSDWITQYKHSNTPGEMLQFSSESKVTALDSYPQQQQCQ
jgi:hypothetical protein